MACWRRCITGDELWGFKSPSQAQCLFSFLQLLDQTDVSTQLILRHHACCHTPCRDGPDSPSETANKVPIKCCLLYVSLVGVSFHSNRTGTKTRDVKTSLHYKSELMAEKLSYFPSTCIESIVYQSSARKQKLSFCSANLV